MSIPKKVAALHDIAGFGRSSLTVVIPVLSALGHQACPVPTAVLSTITGFYEGYKMLDLTGLLPGYLNHWKAERFSFDCIYTGFLASAAQCDIAMNFIDTFKAPLTVVDPVFADSGKLYSCYDENIIKSMGLLIKKADVITPNLTEAAYLIPDDHSHRSAVYLAGRLSEISAETVIITGVPTSHSTVSIIIYKRETNETFRIDNPRIPVNYPGTGDLFASVLTGQMLCGSSVEESAAKAADFVYACIEAAFKLQIPAREGVPLEIMLSRLYENNRLGITKLP